MSDSDKIISDTIAHINTIFPIVPGFIRNYNFNDKGLLEVYYLEDNKVIALRFEEDKPLIVEDK